VNIFKATQTFANQWSKADKKIAEELEGERKVPYFIEELGDDVEKALEQVEIDDVLGYLRGKWDGDGGIKIKEWLSEKFQAFHGAALEKALRARYKDEFMKDVKKIYTGAAKTMREVENQNKKLPDQIKL
jgi:hypothetical protein